MPPGVHWEMRRQGTWAEEGTAGELCNLMVSILLDDNPAEGLLYDQSGAVGKASRGSCHVTSIFI